MRAAALLVVLAATGCAYKVRVDSEPPGATLTLPDRVRVTLPRKIDADNTVRLPATVRLRWFPFQHHVVTVTASGYRSAEIDLARQWARAVDWSDPILYPVDGPRVRADTQITVRLVPEHGPAGSWAADQVP